MKEITSRTMTTQLHSRSTRWSRTRLLLGLLVVLSLTTAMHSHEPAADTNSPAAQVIALTNQARTAAGCASLATDHTLTDSAYTHAADMARGRYLNHTGRDGRSPFDRMRAAGAPGAGYLAENIAAGQRTPEAVVTAWLQSPGHRKNILNCRYQWIGVGVSGTPTTPYWVQNFAG